MTPKQNKNKLMDLGLTVADLVHELHELHPDVSEKSLRKYVDDMIYGRDYYPRYAMYLNTKYDFKFTRPAHRRSARMILKAA